MGEIQKAIEFFIQYHMQKYIAPQKAGDEEEFMLQFKADGGKARKAFQKLAMAVDQATKFKMVRVSNWMNQAQMARAYFYSYYRMPGDLQSEPGMAMRLYQDGEPIGVSWEVSILERMLDGESLTKQRRILTVPTVEQTYYLAYRSGQEEYYPATEDNRYYLAGAVGNGSIRKVIIKSNIGLLKDFDTIEDFVKEALIVMERLYPYYLATREVKRTVKKKGVGKK